MRLDLGILECKCVMLLMHFVYINSVNFEQVIVSVRSVAGKFNIVNKINLIRVFFVGVFDFQFF